MWRRRWHGVPCGIVVAVVVEALVLAYGGVVHLVQLAGGWPPYPWAPGWLTVYFTSLTVLDPLAALLLLARRSAGLYLAVFIFMTDASANWYASYCLPHGTVASRVVQAVICGLALGSLLIARHARPWMQTASLEGEPTLQSRSMNVRSCRELLATERDGRRGSRPRRG